MIKKPKKEPAVYHKPDEELPEEEEQPLEELEDDELEPWEEGFEAGAALGGQLGKDALTGQPIKDADEVIEMELDGKTYRFVSEKNAILFKKKRGQEKKTPKVPIMRSLPKKGKKK
ncbi:MAG: hypothetical protein AABX04_05255 [Nanoarchaeota archaeon]